MILRDRLEEHRALRALSRDVFGAESDSAAVHRHIDGDALVNVPLDSALRSSGLYGMGMPAGVGGGDASLRDVEIVLEAAGEHAASTTMAGSPVLCGWLLARCAESPAAAEWAGRVAAGESISGLAIAGVWDAPLGPEPELVREPDRLSLRGRVPLVLDLPNSDIVVVLARDGADRALVMVETAQVEVRHQATTDRTRVLGALDMADVEVTASAVLASGPTCERLLGELVDRAAIVVAADSVGIAEAVLTQTTTYIKQREQFGRAVGSFQAVKHQVADMLVRTELARALVQAASAALEENRDTASGDASMAKARATTWAAWVAGRGVQLHGGIAYTWEHDMHIYLKRAKFNEMLFGSARWHFARAASCLLQARA